MKSLELLSDSVAAHDVEVVFGLIGDANLFWVDDYVRRRGGRYVAAAHESSVINMATGHAWTTGHVGLATVTHGPGLTNTMTSLVEAVRMRIPLVLIAGDTAALARDHLQNIDQQAVVRPTGAGFEAVRSPATISVDFARAHRRARLERRPIVLNVPADHYWQDVEAPVALPAALHLRPRPFHEDELDQALGAAAGANRPVILVGHGGASDAARPALIRLSQVLGAPLVTSLRAKDLFAGETMNCGILGSIGHQQATDAVTASDVVLAFGASLNMHTTMEGELLRDKRLIHCDDDEASLGGHLDADATVLGDAGMVATRMVELLEASDHAPSSWADGLLASGAEPVPEGPAPEGRTGVLLQESLRRFEEAIPADRVLVSDAGRFAYYVPTLLSVPDPSCWVYAWGGFGAIGLGMGTAIGAAFSDPTRPTVLVTGDGGFMLGGITEFATACREDLDLIVIVCNDGAYGAEYIQYAARDLDPATSTFVWPDLAPVAASLGGRGITVASDSDLGTACDAIADRSTPLLIDVKLDPERVGRPY